MTKGQVVNKIADHVAINLWGMHGYIELADRSLLDCEASVRALLHLALALQVLPEVAKRVKQNPHFNAERFGAFMDELQLVPLLPAPAAPPA